MMTQLCGAGMAFVGFSLSLIIGLYVGNSYITIVWRSLGVMAVFYILGCILSSIGQSVIRENFDDEVERLAAESQETGAGDVVPYDESQENAGDKQADVSKPEPAVAAQ